MPISQGIYTDEILQTVERRTFPWTQLPNDSWPANFYEIVWKPRNILIMNAHTDEKVATPNPLSSNKPDNNQNPGQHDKSRIDETDNNSLCKCTHAQCKTQKLLNDIKIEPQTFAANVATE